MNQESITCPKCQAMGWIKAAAIDEEVKKKITCGKCGHEIKYVKKKWKSAVVS